MALGAVVRLSGLSRPSLWLDEAISAEISARAPAAILEAAAADLHPPGYYLLLHLWTGAVAGPASEWALRSLSCLGSIATLPLLYVLARSAAGDADRRVVARWAALFAAISPYHVAMAQEARPYALLGLVLAGGWTLWDRLRRQEGRGRIEWAGLAFLMAAGLYIHYAAILFWLALGVLAIREGRSFTVRWAATAAAALIAWAPWLPALQAQLGPGARGWLPFHHSPLLIPRTAAEFFRGSAARSDELALWAVPVTALLVLGARSGGRRPAVVAALPLVLAYVTSFFVNIFDPRYLVGSALAVWVLAARGLPAPGSMATRRWQAAAGLLCVAAALWGLAGLHLREDADREDWRGLVAALEAEAAPGAVVVFPFVAPFPPVTYYAGRTDLRLVAGLRDPGEGALTLSPGLPDALDGAPEVFYVEYLEDLYDPEALVRQALSRAGFEDHGIIHQSRRLHLRHFLRTPPAGVPAATTTSSAGCWKTGTPVRVHRLRRRNPGDTFALAARRGLLVSQPVPHVGRHSGTSMYPKLGVWKLALRAFRQTLDQALHGRS